MKNLSEQEIEALKNIHPKKRYLRYGFLALGILIIVLGLILLIFGYDFEITLEGMNLSLFISILIMLFGGIIASKFFIAPYYLRENSITIKHMRDLREPTEKYIKFYSISFSRLIASLLLISVGFISLLVFGTDVGHQVKYGSAISLGGPSWFYLTGLPMFGIGFGLLLYFFLSLCRGIFSKSKNFLFFYEIRPGFPWLTEVPRKEIEAIRYQNNHLGPKLTWIILLTPFIVQQLMTAIPLFFAERAAPSFTLSWTFLIISILDIIALVLLVIIPQNYFEIATKEKLYEMWFSPIRFKNHTSFNEEFSSFLEGKPETSNNELKNENSLLTQVSNRHFQFFRFFFGVFLVISAVLMLTQMILFGPLVWWISLMYGLILIVKAFFYDFKIKSGTKFELKEDLKHFKFQSQSRFKFHYVIAKSVESLAVRKWYRKLDFFDIFGICLMLIFLTIQQTQGWLIADTINLIYDNVISTIYMVIVIFLLLYYICFPIDVIEFKTPSIKYQIEVTLKSKTKKRLFLLLSNFKEGIKHIAESDMKRTFWIRLSFFFFLITGALFYMLLYFLITY